MPDNDALTEVLGVSIDTSQFEDGLNELKALWGQFVEEVGAGNVDGLSAGAFSGVFSDLNRMLNLWAEIAAEVKASIEGIGSTTSDTADRLSRAQKDAEESVRKTKGSDRSLYTYTQRVRPGETLEKAEDDARAENAKRDAIEQEAAEKRLARQRQLAEEIAEEQQGLLDQYAAEQEKEVLITEEAATQKLAAQKRLAEEIAIEQQGLLDQYAAEQEKAAEEAMKATEKAAAERAAAAEKAILEEIAAVEKLNQAYAEAAQKQAQKAKEGGYFVGLAEDIGRVTRFAIEWQVVGAAINAVTEVISAPFKAIEEGVHYLERIDQLAQEISGVLAANVTYSLDLAENFNKTQNAARGVAEALQDIAIRDKIKPENLQNTFNNVVESGAGRGAKNTADLVNLSEGLAAAFKTLGINARTARTEIYNAFNGTPTASSRFLEIVKMSADEWITLRDRAYETGDIWGTLAPKLLPFVDASKRASDTAGELEQRLALVRQRNEAILAQPLYQVYDQLLESAVAWADKNKEAITDLLSGIGQAIALAAKLAVSLATNTPKGLNASGAAEQGGIVDDDGNPINAYTSKEDLQKYLNGSSRGSSENYGPAAPSDSELALRQAIIGINKPPSIDKAKRSPSELPDITAQFQGEMDALKQKQEDFTTAQKLSVESRTKSQADSTKETVAYLKQEEAAVQSLIRKYQDLLQASADAKTPQGKQRIKTDQQRLSNSGSAFSRSVTQAETGAQSEDIKAGQAAEDEANKEHLRQVEETYKEELALKETALKAGHITQEQYLSDEMQADAKAHHDRIAIYQEELAEAGQNQAKKQEALDKITEEDAAYTASVIRTTGERIDAHRKEAAAEAAHNVEMQNLHRERSDTADTIEAGFTPYKSEDAAHNQQQTITDQVQLKEASLAAAVALNAQSDSVRKLQEELAKLGTDRLKALAQELAAIKNSGYGAAGQFGSAQYAIQGSLNQAASSLHTANANVNKAVDSGASQDKIAELQKSASDAADALKQLGGVAKAQSDNTTTAIDQLQGAFTKIDILGEINDDYIASSQKTVDSVTALGQAFQAVEQVLSAVKQGGRQGGVLGAVGAAGNSGVGQTVAGAIGSFADLPGVGEAVGAISGALSLIGQLFVDEAVKIGNTIKTNIQNIMNEYSDQTLSLGNAIAQLQQQEQTAISELSGQKGGQAQLQQILPSLQQQIAQLQAQAQQTDISFGDSFNELALQLQDTTGSLSGIYQQWVQINQQVNTYINAGGSVISAAQDLSNELQVIAQQSQNTLNQGQQQAVQDAINLNNLLEQRTQLVESLNEQAFALQNQDAEERTEAGAVTRADQLQQLQQNSQQQLQDLDYEVQTTQLKVQAESQIFTIAQDINTLHQQDDQLTLTALQQQLSMYQQLQQIVSSITQNANGLFSSTSSLLQPVANPIGGATINLGGITVNVVAPTGTDPGAFGQSVADSVQQAIQQAARSGSPYGS